MILDYIGVKEINGSLIVLDDVENASFEEVVDIRMDDGTMRQGRIVQMEGKRVVIQVFEGTRGISLQNTRTRLLGHPMEMPLSPEILGRVFDGAGRPIDGLGDIFPLKRANINGTPINPVSRIYPKNYINTGISTIDVLMTLIRGQKLPIFSGSGMKHNELAVQIARQAKIKDANENNFAIVFAAMGAKNDVAEYFRRSFDESGVLQKVVMFLNLSNDPIIERILTPRCALTVAEYLAFELGMHVLVIMTDMTSYAEALREFSSSKGEIPGRKGYPGYLYSDLASLYERAGMVRGKEGSVTQIPILTMPNDDVTHRLDRLYHRRTDRSGPRLGQQRHLSAGFRAALPLPSDEGRHRRRIYARGPLGALQPALRRLCQGDGRALAGLRHRRRGTLPDGQKVSGIWQTLRGAICQPGL